MPPTTRSSASSESSSGGLGRCCCLLGHRAAPALDADDVTGADLPAVMSIANFRDTERSVLRPGLGPSRLQRGRICPRPWIQKDFRAAPRTCGPLCGRLNVKRTPIWRVCPASLFDLLMTGLAPRRGCHGKLYLAELSDKSVRIRQLDQGKRCPRFDFGNRDADDGLGRSVFCGRP
jgi:hypothetical protein